MTNIYVIPNWFFGYSIFLEVIFGIITLLVAFTAFKIYRISKERELGLLSAGFVLISASYFAWSLINIFLVEELNETTRLLILKNISVLSVIGIYSHILLFMCGLITLFYMTCKVETDRMYSLVIILAVLGVLFAYDKTLAIYSFSSIILAYIAGYYALTYKKKKNRFTRDVFISFSMLFIANIVMLFPSTTYSIYVIAHFFHLIAFSILLYTLISILKNGQKKKST